MTPEEFKSGRHTLGLSANQCARLFEVSDGRTIRRWEAGDRDIPGPAKVLMRWLLATELWWDILNMAECRAEGDRAATSICKRARSLLADLTLTP